MDLLIVNPKKLSKAMPSMNFSVSRDSLGIRKIRIRYPGHEMSYDGERIRKTISGSDGSPGKIRLALSSEAEPFKDDLLELAKDDNNVAEFLTAKPFPYPDERLRFSDTAITKNYGAYWISFSLHDVKFTKECPRFGNVPATFIEINFFKQDIAEMAKTDGAVALFLANYPALRA